MLTRGLAILLCLSLVAGTAGAEEIHPRFEGLERAADASETFRLNALGVVSHEESGGFSVIVVGGKWWRPVRGKFRYETRYDDFYRMMGRPDLAEQHQSRRRLSDGLYWGGLVAFVGGGALLITGLYSQGFQTRAKVGAGLAAAGVTSLIVGTSIQPPLVSEEDALQMVNEYNRRLRLHLGLGSAAQGERLLLISGRL